MKDILFLLGAPVFIFFVIFFISIKLGQTECDLFMYNFVDTKAGKDFGLDNIYTISQCGINFNGYRCLTNVKINKVCLLSDGNVTINN